MMINKIVSALTQKHDVSFEENKRRLAEIERLNKCFNDYFFDGSKIGRIVTNTAIADGATGDSSLFTSLDKTEIEVRLNFSTDDSQSMYKERFLLHVFNSEYVISDLNGDFLCSASNFHDYILQRVLSKI